MQVIPLYVFDKSIFKSVFENFDAFKKLHPAFANLTKEDMVSNGNSAPLHRGAIKYYKEAYEECQCN